MMGEGAVVIVLAVIIGGLAIMGAITAVLCITALRDACNDDEAGR